MVTGTTWSRWTTAALPEDTVEDLQLTLGEALANAVEHAYGNGPAGACAYSVDRLPDGAVAVRVEDFGPWRPVPADPGFRGRGLMLIRRLAERELEVLDRVLRQRGRRRPGQDRAANAGQPCRVGRQALLQRCRQEPGGDERDVVGLVAVGEDLVQEQRGQVLG